MVLLDGLDEVKHEFTNSVMKAIDNLVTSYEDNRFISSCRIAAYYSNFQQDFQVIELADFDYDQIKQFITNFLADSVKDAKYLDGKKILNAIAAQQGILVQRAEDVYSFSHLTLQEYLTALYINEDESLVRQLITQHLTDKRWRELFLLVAGLKNDASKFLLEMEKATQELMNTDKLHKLLSWTKYIADGSSGDIQPVRKRAIALTNPLAHAHLYAYAFGNALRNAEALANAFTAVPAEVSTNAEALANALALANTLAANALSKSNDLANAYFSKALKYFIQYTNWSKELQIYQDVNHDKLINSLEKLQEQIPEKEATREVYQAFGKHMINVWLKAFKLKPEMVNISRQEIKALDNYFYANLLLLECEQAAVRVSRRTWSEIESRMLMPFREAT